MFDARQSGLEAHLVQKVVSKLPSRSLPHITKPHLLGTGIKPPQLDDPVRELLPLQHSSHLKFHSIFTPEEEEGKVNNTLAPLVLQKRVKWLLALSRMMNLFLDSPTCQPQSDQLTNVKLFQQAAGWQVFSSPSSSPPCCHQHRSG